MNHPTLGMLERLRPPSGFRTEAVLGATYSADLLTCMAVLTTLDGSSGEQLKYGRIEAFRAMDRLRDKVRIYYQAGRLSRRDGARYPSLARLDRILVPIRPTRGSFHPKVWLVRQSDEVQQSRYVLLVSSRNVTTSADWDLGIVIEGVLGGNGKPLPRLRAFVERAFTLGGEPKRLAMFGKLDEVRWTLPPNVSDMEFDFQAGGDTASRLHEEWKHFPINPKRLLLLSPFVDDRMVGIAANQWPQKCERRLVAGTDGLRKVALGPKRDALRALDPRQMAVNPEGTDIDADGDSTTDEFEEDESFRALHAKVIAMDNAKQAIVVLGSNNLTNSGWCGGSTEAFVRLVGKPVLFETLWDWANSHAEHFTFPEKGEPPPETPILEAEKERLYKMSLRLEEFGQQVPAYLEVLDPPTLNLPNGVHLTVSRYTTPQESVLFPNDQRTVELRGCHPALRTKFVVCTLHHGDEQTSWIVSAEVSPPIGDERDHALVARLLGVREFLAYLQSLNSDVIPAEHAEGEKAPATNTRDSMHSLGHDFVHLEGLLRQTMTDPHAFTEMDRAVVRYGELLKKRELADDERWLLDRFLQAWAAIREGWRS